MCVTLLEQALSTTRGSGSRSMFVRCSRAGGWVRIQPSAGASAVRVDEAKDVANLSDLEVAESVLADDGASVPARSCEGADCSSSHRCSTTTDISQGHR